METLNKDVIFILSERLDLIDLLNFCQCNKYIYYREEIWDYKLKMEFFRF